MQLVTPCPVYSIDFTMYNKFPIRYDQIGNTTFFFNEDIYASVASLNEEKVSLDISSTNVADKFVSGLLIVVPRKDLKIEFKEESKDNGIIRNVFVHSDNITLLNLLTAFFEAIDKF